MKGSSQLPEPARLETRERRTLRDDPINAPFSTSRISGQRLEDPRGKALARSVDPAKGSFRRGKRLNVCRNGVAGCPLPEHGPAGVQEFFSPLKGAGARSKRRDPLPLRVRSFQGRARLGDRTRPLDARPRGLRSGSQSGSTGREPGLKGGLNWGVVGRGWDRGKIFSLFFFLSPGGSPCGRLII